MEHSAPLTNTFSAARCMSDGRRKVDFVIVREQERHSAAEQPPHGLELKDRGGSGPEHEHDARRRFFEQNLAREGLELETEQARVRDKPLTVLKLHAPFALLCRYAEELRVKMPLRTLDRLPPPDAARRRCWSLWPSSAAQDKPQRAPHIAWPFKRKALRDHLFDPARPDAFFLDRHRVEIVWEVLQQTSNNPDDPKHRGIAALLEHGLYEVAYPLHDGTPGGPAAQPELSLRRWLTRTWATWAASFK